MMMTSWFDLLLAITWWCNEWSRKSISVASPSSSSFIINLLLMEERGKERETWRVVWYAHFPSYFVGIGKDDSFNDIWRAWIILILIIIDNPSIHTRLRFRGVVFVDALNSPLSHTFGGHIWVNLFPLNHQWSSSICKCMCVHIHNISDWVKPHCRMMNREFFLFSRLGHGSFEPPF